MTCKCFECDNELTEFDLFQNGRFCFPCIKKKETFIVRLKDLEEGDLIRFSHNGLLTRVVAKGAKELTLMNSNGAEKRGANGEYLVYLLNRFFKK